MSSVLYKTEDAFKTVIIGATGLDSISGIYLGAAFDDIVLPYISVVAENSEERAPRGIGNYSVNFMIELHTSADDMDRDDRVSLTNALLNAVMLDNLATLLSNETGYEVFGVLFNAQQQRVTHRSHAYTITGRVDCRNSDPS